MPYLVHYPASTAVTATLTTVSGSARLFVWHPANLFAPDESSPISVSNTQVITFETPTAGIYMFLVYGLQASVYDLSIVPGGGPRVPLDWTANPADAGLAVSSSGVGSADVVDMSTNPILPQSGEDPLSSAQDPGGPYYLLFLPSIFH